MTYPPDYPIHAPVIRADNCEEPGPDLRWVGVIACLVSAVITVGGVWALMGWWPW